MKSDGFIHCSSQTQATERAAKMKSDDNELLLLEIDENQVLAEIVYEDLYGLNQMYPHIYGKLNLEAVVAIHPIQNGIFILEELP